MERGGVSFVPTIDAFGLLVLASYLMGKSSVRAGGAGRWVECGLAMMGQLGSPGRRESGTMKAQTQWPGCIAARLAHRRAGLQAKRKHLASVLLSFCTICIMRRSGNSMGQFETASPPAS